VNFSAVAEDADFVELFSWTALSDDIRGALLAIVRSSVSDVRLQ